MNPLFLPVARRMRNTPEIVEVDSTQLEEVLRRVEQSLDEKDAELIRAVFESYAYVADLVEDKNTSIRRLRQLFFGARTEKTDAVVGQQGREARRNSAGPHAGGRPSWLPANGQPTSRRSEDGDRPRNGHGRNGADAYRGAARIDVPHPSLDSGRPVSRLRSGHRLRKGSGRAGADHRAAAAGGDDLPVAKTALPSVRPGVHGGTRPKRRASASTTPRPAA